MSVMCHICRIQHSKEVASAADALQVASSSVSSERKPAVIRRCMDISKKWGGNDAGGTRCENRPAADQYDGRWPDDSNEPCWQSL